MELEYLLQSLIGYNSINPMISETFPPVERKYLLSIKCYVIISKANYTHIDSGSGAKEQKGLTGI